MHPEEIYDEGINGLGEGVVNTNSPSFKVLREKIAEESRKRDPVERIKDRLLGIRFQMEDFIQDLERPHPMASGEVLKSCVQILGIKHKLFAAYLDMDESNLSSIYSGRRKINLDLAMKLEKIFHIPSHLWINVQNKGELLELSRKNPGRYQHLGLKDLLSKAGQIGIKSPADSQEINKFTVLDAGEAEAIVLALELKSKEYRIIDEVTSWIDILVDKGFWIAKDLYDRVRELAGE